MKSGLAVFALLLLAIAPAPGQFGPSNATKLRGRAISPTAPSDTQVLCYDATLLQWKPCAAGAAGALTGSGTIGKVARFTGSTAVGDSGITDDGSMLTMGRDTTIAANSLMNQFTNANPGTVTNKLVKIDGSGNALITATTDTTNIFGICQYGCGNSGNSQVALLGLTPCVFDGTTVVRDFVTASTTVAGDCHDAGATEPTGVQVMGRIMSVNTGTGTTAIVNIYSPDTVNASPALKSFTVANANPGTTLNKLVKLTGAPSTATISAVSDTGGVIGICSSGCANGGSAVIIQGGSQSCVFDGATTAGHYVQISSTVAGDCHDISATYPTSGQVLGRVLSTNASAGTYTVAVFSPEITGGSGTPTTNTIISIALPVGVCQGTTATTGFSLPSSNAPVAACITGTNVNMGELQFPASVTSTIQHHLQVPYNADCTQAMNLVLKWRAVSITNSTTWGIKTAFTADAAVLDGSWNTASTVAAAPPGTTLQLKTSTISGFTKTGCAAGSEMFFQVYRDSADTMTGDAELISAQLQYSRTY